MIARIGTGCFILVAVLLTAGSAAAQEGEGCPRCKSETECEWVKENTPHSTCEDDSGTCEVDQGACTIGAMLLPERREATLEAAGIEYRGAFVAEIEGGRMTVFGIDDGLFARWGCNGELTGIFKQGAQGEWLALDTESFGDRFTLLAAGRPNLK